MCAHDRRSGKALSTVGVRRADIDDGHSRIEQRGQLRKRLGVVSGTEDRELGRRTIDLASRGARCTEGASTMIMVDSTDRGSAWPACTFRR